MRYSTGLDTRGTWATDSNGRDMQRRRRNHRDDWRFKNVTEEPVASNYYPFGSVATLTGDARAGFHLLTDRSQGVGSIRDGELEAMGVKIDVVDLADPAALNSGVSQQ